VQRDIMMCESIGAIWSSIYLSTILFMRTCISVLVGSLTSLLTCLSTQSPLHMITCLRVWLWDAIMSEGA